MKKRQIIRDFTDFDNRKWKDRIPGGYADNKEPSDYDTDDIIIGTAVEKEHTNNPDIATELSMDHLERDSEYYDKLISAGLVDDDDVIDLFDNIKGKNVRNKSQNDIKDYINRHNLIEDDYENEMIDDDEDDDEDFNDYKQNENKQKNNKKNMKNSIKDYNSFLKESNSTPSDVQNEQRPPERKYSKENKYKFQMPYSKEIVDSLDEYSFSYEGEKPKNPSDRDAIIIDILTLSYSIVKGEQDDIKKIDLLKLKHILDGL